MPKVQYESCTVTLWNEQAEQRERSADVHFRLLMDLSSKIRSYVDLYCSSWYSTMQYPVQYRVNMDQETKHTSYTAVYGTCIIKAITFLRCHTTS